MRHAIYFRLIEIKNEYRGFPNNPTRFKDKFISDICFSAFEDMDEYTDEELIELFELVIEYK